MEKLIHVQDGDVSLEGLLKIPKNTQGIVLFAHGSGSGRFSPRNNFVANVLNEAGLGTLLIDLLTHQEDEVYETRFDIDLLSSRLATVIEWLQQQKETKNLAIGLFGASTGAAAALQVGSRLSSDIKAIISRGGRPDMVIPLLKQVTAPTLFIVGGNDFTVLELNQKAFNHLLCEKEFQIIPYATHLFEEPGALEEVSRLAKDWFIRFL